MPWLGDDGVSGSGVVDGGATKPIIRAIATAMTMPITAFFMSDLSFPVAPPQAL